MVGDVDQSILGFSFTVKVEFRARRKLDRKSLFTVQNFKLQINHILDWFSVRFWRFFVRRQMEKFSALDFFTDYVKTVLEDEIR